MYNLIEFDRAQCDADTVKGKQMLTMTVIKVVQDVY